MYNTGAELLGVLITRAAGQSLETFLRERIFEPLGKRDTGFSVPATEIHRLAASYWIDPANGALAVYDEAAHGQWSRSLAFPSGGAGLVSTADDFLAFGRMMLGGGRLGDRRILSAASVEAMTTDQLTPAEKAASVDSLAPGFWRGRGWGFGLCALGGRGGTGPARYGWDGGLGTSWYNYPGEGAVAILMTQVGAYPDTFGTYLDFWASVPEAIGAFG